MTVTCQLKRGYPVFSFKLHSTTQQSTLLSSLASHLNSDAINNAEMLCETCKGALETSALNYDKDIGKKGETPARHHSNLADLTMSASLPCYICKTLLILLEKNRLHGEDLSDLRCQIKCVRGDDKNTIWFIIWGAGNYNRQFGESTRFLVSPVLDPAVEYKATSQTTDSETCFSLAQEWLKICASEHSTCNRLRNSDWYPTRVLDVEDHSSDSVKLVETALYPISGHYMTLSHCWGGRLAVTLTRDNLEHFKQSILIKNLPRTFIEAILVARAFDVRYLWIDCLCIIQDMTSDWEKEAAQMDRVYQHSYCNIGAADSCNSEGGLFRTRNPTLVNTPQWSSNGIKYDITWDEVLQTNLELSPLYKRGWVLQERWLCPRMLHFSSNQIFWECRTAVASETLPALCVEPRRRQLKYESHIPENESAQSAERLGVLAGRERNTWTRIAANYSEANLTYDTDKLVALSGIVKVFSAREHQDEYLAGLWKRYFASQLSWGVWGENPLSYDQYIAPSWSWASIHGQVVFYYPRSYTGLAELTVLIDHHLDYSTSDPTGRVISGWALLQGPLREILITKVHAYGDGPTRIRQNGIFRDKMAGLSAGSCYFKMDTGFLYEEDWKETFYLLPLFWNAIGTSDESLVGIILRLKPGTNDSFIRVGCWDCRDCPWGKKISKPSIIESLPHVSFDPEKGHSFKIF